MQLSRLAPLVFTGLALSAAASAQTFMPIDLGVAPGYNVSDAFDVNIHQEVIGNVSLNGSNPEAFIWLPQANYGLPAGMTVLGTLGMSPGQFSFAGSINDCGQVVGTSSTPLQFLRAFIWQNGVMTDAGALTGINGTSAAHDITNRGLVVGSSQNSLTPPIETHAFATFFPCNQPLPPSPLQWDMGTLGGDSARALAVNELGNVVGQSRLTGTFASNAFFASGPTAPLVDLGTLPGGSSSTAEDINDRQIVVGHTEIVNSPIGLIGSRVTAWRMIAGQWGAVDLGSFNNHLYNEAYGVNNQGDIIGRSYTNGVTEPFLWTAGTFHNLNSLLVGGGGIVIEEALGLNENGDIAAFGQDAAGNNRGFLLVRQ